MSTLLRKSLIALVALAGLGLTVADMPGAGLPLFIITKAAGLSLLVMGARLLEPFTKGEEA